MHNFLIARFYHYMTREFGEQGYQAFRVAFQMYAEQRGLRIAQAVLRAGKPLHYQTYRAYADTETGFGDGILLQEQVTGDGWYTAKLQVEEQARALKENGGDDRLVQYVCTHLDRIMVKAFYTDIRYEAVLEEQVCVHRCTNPGITSIQEQSSHEASAAEPAFLLANLYFTMRKDICAMLSDGGKRIAMLVQADFVNKFGETAWQSLEKYEKVNFNLHS